MYSVKIDGDEKITQKVGFETKLNAIVFKNEEQTDYKVTWESTNQEVVNVDELGNIKILDYGEAEIIARFEHNLDVFDSIIINSVENLPNIEYYKFSPIDVDTILQGDEQVFTIYHYKDFVPDEEKFEIVLSGVPNEDKYENYFYSVFPVGGDIKNCNEFKIINNRAFNRGKLKIEAVSTITGETVNTIYIRLGGLI